MTTANKVTIFRILLIPVFVVELVYYAKTGREFYRVFGTCCFAVAAICDGLDGYIARHFNQRSELGAILDPLADKLLLVSGVVLLSCDLHPALGTIPFWLTGIIIGRDIILLAGFIVIQMMVGKVPVKPRLLGKIATVFQMSVVLWILLGFPQRWFPLATWGAAVCTGVSGLLYLYDGTRQLNAHPASSPARTEP